jgi:hypothetical protein
LYSLNRKQLSLVSVQLVEVAAGNDNSRGAACNEEADERSYRAMIDFFNEIFM